MGSAHPTGLSRWHTERQAVPNTGSVWIATRTKPEVKAQYERGLSGGKGQNKRLIKAGEPTEREVYLQSDELNKEGWYNSTDYDNAKRIDNDSGRTPEQKNLLRRGHWSNREIRQ